MTLYLLLFYSGVFYHVNCQHSFRTRTSNWSSFRHNDSKGHITEELVLRKKNVVFADARLKKVFHSKFSFM